MNKKSLDEKLIESITLIKRAEALSLQYSENGFFLAFSGGKDSQALYHVAKMAGVKFVPHYSVTTLDPPELVRFIKQKYPDVIFDFSQYTFSQLCLKKKALPTKIVRFCCSELKETKGAGFVTLTGVRRQESRQRALRNEMEIVSKLVKYRQSGEFQQIMNILQENKQQEIRCVNGRDKIVINPLIEWTDKNVWDFLNDVAAVPHCELYDRGWKRIGCLFCPYATKKELARMEKEYPKYTEIFLRLIHRLRERGWMNNYESLTDKQILQWWTSKKNMKKWYSENILQYSLIFR